MRTAFTCELPIAAIDIEDDLYQIHYDAVPTPLMESIKNVGLVNPPVLEAKDHARYRVVLGFRRLRSLIALQHKTVQAKVVSSGSDLFTTAICENISIRPFNPVECSIILNKLIYSFHQEREVVVAQYMPLLGLGSHAIVFNRLLPLAGLEGEIKEWVAEGRLSIEAAASLSKMTAGDRGVLFHLISTLQLGKNKQRELLTLSADVAKLQEMTVQRLFDSSDIMTVIENAQISPAHRAEKLKDWLLAKRYPKFSAAQQRFFQLKGELALPSHVELKPPPFFESEEYMMTLRFSSAAELATMAKALLRIAGGRILNKLFSVAYEEQQATINISPGG